MAQVVPDNSPVSLELTAFATASVANRYDRNPPHPRIYPPNETLEAANSFIELVSAQYKTELNKFTRDQLRNKVVRLVDVEGCETGGRSKEKPGLISLLDKHAREVVHHLYSSWVGEKDVLMNQLLNAAVSDIFDLDRAVSTLSPDIIVTKRVLRLKSLGAKWVDIIMELFKERDQRN